MVERLEVAGLAVQTDLDMRALSLRYFEPDGAFGAAVRAATGAALPISLTAAAVSRPGEAELILAWRSPTETLVFCSDATRLARLISGLAGAAGGCCVDLSGGLRVLRLSGERAGELLRRLGGTASVPPVFGARRSRLAEVPVLALCVHEGETLLAVDRAYAEHLMGWIRATLTDFP